MIDRVVLVHSDRGRSVDGIRDYTRRMADELRRRSVRVEVRLDKGGKGDLRTEGAIVLQYSPFNFARWGFAPWLPMRLLLLRLSTNRPRLAVMVHEPYVPMNSWRWVLMGVWQRLQLAAICLIADVIFASIEAFADDLRAGVAVRPVHHLPVGSNFPDARDQRSTERVRLGADEKSVVLACLGRDHPAWLADHVVAASNGVAAAGHPTILLCMGAEAPELQGLDPAVRLVAPGFLEDHEFAAMIAASDLFLAPFIDGISTRRGSLMVALQHGVPVVGTVGHLTDSMLRGDVRSIILAPLGSPARFADAACSLASDPPARSRMGAAARALYERSFDWPVVAEKMLANLGPR